ncbi:MAG: translation initiation factor IF-2 subunit alpha [Methanomassiliicoccaceae archaeon]|nr:translation initiation factor IF-2 subunit alpha [Methanomassiliicoccaceae archaeon]MCL2143623.1 translation initiation factor IF-2 subunit alpha [Methanomassiliicoccaceae archaeon]
MSRAKGFPEDGELVVCTVKSVKNFGAFVTLDEYDEKEGFVHVRDVTTGWVKYIRDFIREGQKIVCKVLGVDSSKGHIDLSLKSVNEHQKREKIQQWKNEKKAEKLMEIIAERLSVSVDDAYASFGNKVLETYETLYGAFEAVAAAADEFREEFKGKWIDTFIEVAAENVTLPYVQIEGILELRSSAPNGVDLIKNAMKKGEKAAKDSNVTMQYVGAPRYRLVITADDYKEAEDVMKVVSSAVIDDLVKAGGEAVLKRESK